MHSKTKINSHKDYDGPHEEDRKMVDNSEDSKEGLKSDKIKEKGATESVQGTNTGAGTNQAHLNLNPTVKEDEATNFPEYASEFNTDRFWSSAEKWQRNFKKPVGQIVSREPQKEENLISRDFKKGYQGFDLDDISTSYSKLREQSQKRMKEHIIISSLGEVKIKYHPLISASGIGDRGLKRTFP